MVKVMLVVLIALLAGCATPPGSFCDVARPIRPEPADVEAASGALVTQIVTHNEKGEALCGWNP